MPGVYHPLGQILRVRKGSQVQFEFSAEQTRTVTRRIWTRWYKHRAQHDCPKASSGRWRRTRNPVRTFQLKKRAGDLATGYRKSGSSTNCNSRVAKLTAVGPLERTNQFSFNASVFVSRGHLCKLGHELRRGSRCNRCYKQDRPTYVGLSFKEK